MIEIIKYIVIPGAAVFFAGIGGAITIYIYYRNSQLQRAQWLYSLFEKFFYECQYADIRQLLDYPKANEQAIKRLQDVVKSHADVKLEEKFVDYLNFFEFIASLWKLGQLPMREIQMMFDYYIRRLGDYDFVMNYLQCENFEGLAALVVKVRSLKKPE